jgi:hypothetical protein
VKSRRWIIGGAAVAALIVAGLAIWAAVADRCPPFLSGMPCRRLSVERTKFGHVIARYRVDAPMAEIAARAPRVIMVNRVEIAGTSYIAMQGYAGHEWSAHWYPAGSRGASPSAETLLGKPTIVVYERVPSWFERILSRVLPKR